MAVVEWIQANPDRSVTGQSIRGRQGDGADAYIDIVSRVPAATPPAIFNAIRLGVSRRVLEYTMYKQHDRKTGKRLIAGPAFTGVYPSEDLQEELHTSDAP